MKTIEVVLNEKRNVRLTAFIQDVEKEYRNITKRPGVLVIPGGGYMFCSDREAEPVALAYLNAGYDAFILRYTTNEVGSWPDPLEDYENAMHYIIEHAEEWNVIADKIAVAGFSAGGHLAGAAATIAKHKPAAAILGYAVLNEQVDEIAANAPRIAEEVNYDTCPCFLFAARTDNVVPIRNSIQMMDALDKAGVTFESHIYAYGPHGFSTGDESIQTRESAFCPRIPNWVKDSIGFLKDVMGDFYVGTAEDKVLKKPNCKTHITDDGAVSICGTDQKGMDEAKRMIEIITTDFEAGQIFTGHVVSIKEFGAFLEFAPGKEGMVHISKISKQRINRVEDVLTLGDKVKVICLGKEKMGRISFSMKDVPEEA